MGLGRRLDHAGNADYAIVIHFPGGFGLCLVITVVSTMHNLSHK